MTPHALVTYAIAGWSGYFVMALELLGGRALSPWFGTGIYVWGALITSFMLSLSIGYLAGGSLSAREPSLGVLSLLLLGSALAALPCALFADSILEAIFTTIEDPRYGALAASGALFFLPITIAGAVSPYAVRLLAHSVGTSGRVAGRVFFVSTLGSTLGTLLSSFYLILIFELNRIFIGMIAISIVVALLGLSFHWLRGRTDAATAVP